MEELEEASGRDGHYAKQTALMGMAKENQAVSFALSSSLPKGSMGNAGRCCRSFGRTVAPQCTAAMFLSTAIVLSTIFWLLPFHQSWTNPDLLEGLPAAKTPIKISGVHKCAWRYIAESQ